MKSVSIQQNNKIQYLVFDLFGTITTKRYLPALLGWYLVGKKPNKDLIDSKFRKILEALSDSYILCILSNANHDFVKSFLNKSGLDQYFKHIVISSEIGARKPSPRAFESLIEAGIDPSKSLFIDDRKTNRAVAKKMGFSVLDFKGKPDLLNKLSDL